MTAFKVGDRVRYTGRHPMSNPAFIGLEGVVERLIANKVRVQFAEAPAEYSSHRLCFFNNLELIDMNKIDTTKPLVVFDGSNFQTEATFITETSEGHYLVGSAQGRGSSWYIFDKQGKFVRSETGLGVALKLRNKEVEKTLYVRVSASDHSRDQTSLSQDVPGGDAVAAIKLTVKDGVVVAAELERSNRPMYPLDAFVTIGGTRVEL